MQALFEIVKLFPVAQLPASNMDELVAERSHGISMVVGPAKTDQALRVAGISCANGEPMPSHSPATRPCFIGEEMLPDLLCRAGAVRSDSRHNTSFYYLVISSRRHGWQTYSMPAEVTIIWHRFTFPQLEQRQLTTGITSLSLSIIFLTRGKSGERRVNHRMARLFYANVRLDF